MEEEETTAIDVSVKPPVPPEGALGERTENHVATLAPYIQEDVRMALYEMQQTLEKEGGYVRIIQSYRSKEEQEEVYARGASSVRGGYSYHQYGLAFDIGFFDADGNYLGEIPPEWWETVRDIGEKHGFEWGGRWSGRDNDPPHFQMPYGYTTSELLNMPTIEGSDYVRQVDPDRKYQPQFEGRSKPPVWER